MDGFQVRELVVVRVDADAEEEAGVATVDDLVVAELPRELEHGLQQCERGRSPRRSWTGTSGPGARLVDAPHHAA